MGLCLEGRRPVLPYAAHSNGQSLPATILLLRLRSPALPPRSYHLPLIPGASPSLERKIDSESLELSAKPRTLRVRGFAERAESTESERSKEPTGPLLWGGGVSPQTKFPTTRH